MGQLDPKSSGGEGFDFEDKVTAYFISSLLSGAETLPTLRLGHLLSIRLQRKVDGWELDDLILEFDGGSIKRQVAFSVKSNSQITANKIPEDLNASIWRQFCKKTENPFRSRYDYLGLITSGTSTAAIESLRTLSKFASRHRGSDLSIHLQKPEFTNQHVRDLYSSFERPSSVQCEGITNTDVIDRFIHFDINLDDPTSPFLKEAFANLSLVLSEGDANELWIRLQHIAKTARSVAGELSFDDLVNQLKDGFTLKGHRRLEEDQKRLKDIFDIETSKVDSAIGNKLSLVRNCDIVSRAAHDQINALIGESGIGKSSLLKQWAMKSKNPTFWLSYSLFKARSLAEINFLLGLKNDLFDIIQFGPSEQILVIDGIDRLTSPEERSLLKSFLIRFLKVSSGRHQCFVISQDQIWKSILPALSSSEVPFNVITAPYFSSEELQFIALAIPSLAGLLKLKQTQQVFRNPKYIDLAVKMSDVAQIDTSKAVSEPILIRGFWALVTDNETSLEKQRLLFRIATDQADMSNFSTDTSSLSSEETKVATDLARDGVIKIESGSIRFVHDLYGDWIRQRVLLSRRDKYLREVVAKKGNVYWHQAIRLLSIEILEVNGVESWRGDVSKLRDTGDEVVVDLFLDIAITSLNQRFILESIAGHLFENEFQGLIRLLERFIAYATLPNPAIMSLRESFGLDELQAAQINRVPLYTYWPGMVRFLLKHIDSIKGGRSQIAQIAEKWLTNTPVGFPFRKEAAQLAFKCANWIFELKHGDSRTFVRDDIDKTCYQALLAAYVDQPSEIEELTLKLIDLMDKSLPLPVLPKQKAPVAKSFIATHRRIEKKSWPMGPLFKKDDNFQSVCLSSPNFLVLAKNNPNLARRVLLAAIIENPTEWEDMYDDGWGLNDRLCISYTREFYPPFYSKGPFLNFLRIAPDHAVDTLIDLLKFVTDRWAEHEVKRGHDAFSLSIEANGKTKIWRGDPQVFVWYSGAQSHCPDVVVSGLMALEKWFYEKIEANEDITRWIDQILEKSDSLAFVGLFSVLAKKSPKLFIDKLKFLLTQSYVIRWDQQYLLQSKSGFVARITWTSEDQFMTNLARQWYLLEHRNITIEQWSLHFFLNVREMRPFFDAARSAWEQELKKGNSNYLEALSCKFDAENYQEDSLTDGTRYWKYVPPERFVEKNKKRFEENDARLLCLMFSRKISTVLDDISKFNEEVLQGLTSDLDRIISTIGNDPEDQVIQGYRDCSLAIDGLRLIAQSKGWHSVTNDLTKQGKTNIENAIRELWQDARIAGHPYDISEESYDAILAKVFGILCVQNESDPWIRLQVARLACGPRAVPAQAFISSAVWNGAKPSIVLQLLHLLFEQSKATTVWHEVAHILQFSKDHSKQSWMVSLLAKNEFIRTRILKTYTPEDRELLFSNWINNRVAEFVSGESPARWPTWNFEPSTFEFARDIELRSAEREIINLESFTRAVSALPEIHKWNDDLRNGWADFCSQGGIKIANRLKDEIKKTGDIRGTPYSQDTWLIRTLAITYFLEDGDVLLQSIKSFFEVGPKGHYWLDDFGKDFFGFGVREKARWSRLKQKIDRLLDLCSSISALQSESWDADDIWCTLIGLDSLSIRFMPDDSAPLVRDLFPIYEKWMHLRKGSLKCLVQLIDLLSSKVAAEIRVKGLAIVASELEGANFSDYSHERYIGTYSNFLAVIWQENKTDLRDDKDSLALLQKILNGLISVQDPKALELATQISSTHL